jgi:hypothetical protein
MEAEFANIVATDEEPDGVISVGTSSTSFNSV